MVHNRTKYLTRMALLLSLASVMGYLEALIPLNIGIPGIKLGLANYVVVLVMYLFWSKGCSNDQSFENFSGWIYAIESVHDFIQSCRCRFKSDCHGVVKTNKAYVSIWCQCGGRRHA